MPSPENQSSAPVDRVSPAGAPPNLAAERQHRFLEAFRQACADLRGNAEQCALMQEVAARAARVFDDELREADRRTADLRESEERYRTLFEMSSDAVFLIDAAGRIRAANAAAARMHGFTAAELTTMRITDLDTPESARSSAARVHEILAGRTLSFEVTHRRKDGSTFPLEVTAGAVRINGENLVLAFDRDITLRQATERALRDSELKFRSVFDHSPVIICLLTLPEGVLLEVNAAAEAAFGLKRAEVVGRSAAELGVWADPADRERYLALLCAQGEVKGFEARMRRRDGRLFTALYSGSIVIADGQRYSVNLLQDISARKESEAARDRALAQAQATLESTTDGILVIDREGRIQSYNRTFAEMWRLPAAALAAGDNVLALQHATPQLVDPAAFLAQISALAAHPHRESFDTLQFKDGRTIERYSRPQLLNGVPAGRVWCFRDITARLRAEAERAQLEASLRRAKQLDSIGTLAGGVAHDFNNLIGGMCGYVEITQDRLPAGDPNRATLALALDLGQRARELMRKILTFSQQTPADFKPLDLAAAVAEGLKVSQFALPAGAELRSTLADDCPPIAADPSQMQQVVLNLCTNAAHALPAQGGRIEVSVSTAALPPSLATAHPALVDQVLVRLAVSDNGCGMDQATLERVFEPFFTTKSPGRGTGLGLAVVHGIVGAHHGAIDVRSQPGAGTTFELFFPALPAAPLDFPEVAAAAAPCGHDEPILWVDDNPATGEVIEQLLSLSGFTVTRCTSSHDALARFRANPAAFSMLITDLAMPDLDGEGLARAVLAVRRELPVLVVTGMVEARQREALQAAGVREIVFKPVRRDDLARAVARHLPSRRAP